MNKKLYDELFYIFQEVYDSEIVMDFECQKASKEYNKLFLEISAFLPEKKQEIIEKLDEAKSWEISANKRALFCLMMKYFPTLFPQKF